MSPRPHTGNPGGCHLRAPTTGPTRGRSGGIELCDSQDLRPGDRQSPLTCGYGICGVSQVKASRGPLRGPTAVLRTQTAAPTVPLGPGGPSASRPCRPLTDRRAAEVSRRRASCSRLWPGRGVPQRVRCARNGRDVRGVEHLDDDASDRRAVGGQCSGLPSVRTKTVAVQLVSWCPVACRSQTKESRTPGRQRPPQADESTG
jgi:hypothetical protein